MVKQVYLFFSNFHKENQLVNIYLFFFYFTKTETRLTLLMLSSLSKNINHEYNAMKIRTL